MVDFTQAVVYEDPRPLAIGAVLSKTARVFAMAPVPFLVLGVISIVPKLVSEMLVMQKAAAAPMAIVVTFLLQTIVGYLVQASVSYGAFYALRNTRFVLGDALMVGVRRFLPVLLASLLVMIVVGVGFLLLLIPGFMALSALLVVVPVCTIERLGPIASLRRSAWLTKGSRWRIFGAFLIIMIVSGVVVFLAASLLRLIGGTFLGVVATDLVQIVSSTITGIFVAVLYYDLRASREGVLVETIADVFD